MASVSSHVLRFEPIPKMNLNQTTKSRRASTTVCARNRRLVDESLIVLRKRIHEMKMVERKYEPPMEWMDWEKEMYTIYDSIICDAMGLLQSYMLDTRPSLALGMMALVALSVPFSTCVVMFKLLDIAKRLVL